MEREACVCDHGYERSDLCAEIIIIIIIIHIKKCTDRPTVAAPKCQPSEDEPPDHYTVFCLFFYRWNTW